MNQAQHFLLYALSIGALEFVPEGRKLKSGRMSPYFFNSGLFYTAVSVGQLAEAYVATLGRLPSVTTGDVLFGPAYKGIPLVVATADAALRILKINLSFAFDRKEAKDHGEGGLLVGAPLKGQRVVVQDDVMTNGTSSGQAVEMVRVAGGTVIGCVIAFDRQEKGKESDLSAVQEFEKNYDIPVYAVATLADLIEFLEQVLHPMSAKMLPKILAYQAQYGVQQMKGVRT